MKFYRLPACWATFLLATTLLAKLGRGQQVPAFNATVVLGSNETFRSSFCDIHRRVEKGVIPLRFALKDFKLRPGIFRYQLDKETGAIAEVDPPIGIKMLDEIARRGQFQWRDSYGVVDSPGENQTWDEVLAWSVDTYDINGDWFLRTTERLADGILFPEKWYDGSLIMVRKQSEDDDFFSWMAFLKPFSYTLWCLIVASILISGFVYWAIEFIGCDGDQTKMEVSFRESIFQSFLNATGQYIFDPREPGNRLVAFSTCMLFLIILAAYTANLASFLVIRNSPDLVINDIQDVVKNDLRTCVWRSTTSENYMRERYETAKLVLKDSLEDSYLGLDAGDCDIVLTTIGTWETKKSDLVYNADCRKEWVGRVVQFNDAGFSLRDSVDLCSSLLRDVISLHLLEMKRDKTYATIWDTHRRKSATNNCNEDAADKVDDLIELKAINVGGIFVLHAIILILSVGITFFSKHRRVQRAKLSRGGNTTNSPPGLNAYQNSNKNPKTTSNKNSNKNSKNDTSKSATGATAKLKGVTSNSLNSNSTSLKSDQDIDAKLKRVTSNSLNSNSNSTSLKSDQDIEDNNLILSEEGGPSGASSNKADKQIEYIARTMERQMEYITSVQKQMDAIQSQLTELKEEKSKKK